MTTLQLEAFRQLLDYFIKGVKVEHQHLMMSYSYIFFENTDFPEIEMYELEDAVVYLKLLREENGLLTIDELKAYYEQRFAEQMERLDVVERTEVRSHLLIKLQSDLFAGKEHLWRPSVNSLATQGSGRVTTWVNPKGDIEYLMPEISFLLFGKLAMRVDAFNCTAKKMSTSFICPENYLRNFSTHERLELVFVYDAHLHKGVLDHRKPDRFLDINNQCRPIDRLKEQGKSFLHYLDSLYTHLYEIIRLEKPITGSRVKKEIAQWIFLAKYLFDCNATWQEHLHDRGMEFQSCVRRPDLKAGDNWKSSIIDFFESCYDDSFQFRKWEILKSPPGTVWITSDNPGFIAGPGDAEHLRAQVIGSCFWKVVADKNTFYFPFSKDYCLRIIPEEEKPRKSAHGKEIEFVQTSEEELNNVNQLAVAAHPRFLIAGDKSVLAQLQHFA